MVSKCVFWKTDANSRPARCFQLKWRRSIDFRRFFKVQLVSLRHSCEFFRNSKLLRRLIKNSCEFQHFLPIPCVFHEKHRFRHVFLLRSTGHPSILEVHADRFDIATDRQLAYENRYFVVRKTVCWLCSSHRKCELPSLWFASMSHFGYDNPSAEFLLNLLCTWAEASGIYCQVQHFSNFHISFQSFFSFVPLLLLSSIYNQSYSREPFLQNSKNCTQFHMITYNWLDWVDSEIIPTLNSFSLITQQRFGAKEKKVIWIEHLLPSRDAEVLRVRAGLSEIGPSCA